MAYARIAAYHAHEGTPPGPFESGGVSVDHLTRPVGRAGIYAPGGRARYPSTVLMCAAPARVAGVEDIVLCVPPAADGKVDDATLAAAAIAGITEVYRIGGAQAVAAMAYGTASVPRVDVIAGPGNAYVAEAKRQVSGVVGVASAFAGPSEIVVVAGPGAPPEFVAIDLVVQAEHGPDGLAWLVTWDEELLAAVSCRGRPHRGGLAPAGRPRGHAGHLGHRLPGRRAGGRHGGGQHGGPRAPPAHGGRRSERASLLDQVQSAGAVFIGPWSPASLGDYIAGPNHVLPTNRTARFSSALRADDFRKHIHAVTVTPAGAAGARSGRHHPGRDRGPAGARRLGPPPPRRSGRPGIAGRGGRVDMSALPPIRPDLSLTEGYHSPQVEAEVRLNTNESPFPPPEEWSRDLLAALAEVSFHRYPDRPATELRAAIAALHGVTPEEVFCANGSNEVLQCLLLAYGGPGRKAAVFEPTYALHSHISRLTGTAVVEGGRTEDFRIDPDEARALLAREQPDITFLCSPNNPTGRAEPHGDRGRASSRRPRASSSSMRPTASSPSGAPSPYAGPPDTPAWSSPARSPRRGPWPAPASATPSPTPRWCRPARPWCCRTTCRPRPSWPACWPCATPTRWRPGWRSSPRSGAGWRPPWATCRSKAGPRMPISSSSAPCTTMRTRYGAGLLERSVLIRNCASWDGLRGCLRVTIGRPDENDRFLTALEECSVMTETVQ